MVDHLPRALTLSLNDDETTMSYVSRVAMLNGRPPREFCRDIGANPSALALGDRGAIERLARATRADADAIESRIFIRKERNRYVFRGEPLAVQGLDFKRLRFCPLCITDDATDGAGPPHVRPYLRAAWIMTSYRNCPVHHSPLITRTSVSELDFAGIIASANNATASAHLTDSDCRFEAYVDERLRGRRDPAHWLDLFRIDAAGRVCELVGATELFPGRYVSSLDTSEVCAAQRHGFGVTCNGPKAVRALFERVRNARDLPPVTPAEAWPALNNYLRTASDAVYDPLREILYDFSVATMPLGEGDICMGRKVSRRLIHSVRTAAKQRKTHPNRLRRLLEKGGFVSDASSELYNERVLFDAKASDTFLELVAESMPWQAAVRYLNLPPRYDRRLLGEEFLKPLAKPGDGPLTQHVFPKRRLDEFLDRLTANGSALCPEDDRFLDIRGAARTTECHEYDIVRMLFSSQLINVRIDPAQRAYSAIFVDPEEVERVISRRYHGMTKRQAGKTIRTRITVVNALIRNGMIETFICNKPTQGRRRIALVPESVERFAERYVSLATLSIETGKHHTALLKSLDQIEVEPAFPKELLKAQFYERARLAHLS